jgi:hypothetical protein
MPAFDRKPVPLAEGEDSARTGSGPVDSDEGFRPDLVRGGQAEQRVAALYRSHVHEVKRNEQSLDEGRLDPLDAV